MAVTAHPGGAAERMVRWDTGFFVSKSGHVLTNFHVAESCRQLTVLSGHATSAARIVAQHLIAELQGGERPGSYDGRGSCYIEFGAGRVGSVDIDFLSGPTRTGKFNPPSAALVAEKEQFGSSRRARWFGS